MAVVSHAETVAIQGFLRYLNQNYSKRISVNDTYLIAAVSAWFHQESGSLRNVLGNNPFNIRQSPLAVGYRKTRGNGSFAIFATMAMGFAAAARVLMRAGGTNDAYGYRLALRALLKGGNQGAVDFLAALSMSKWSADHYGVHSWQDAYNPKKNHLLRNYVGITGIQLKDPKPKAKPKPPKPRPILPKDYNYVAETRTYLDPWEVKNRYDSRHRGRSSAVVAMSTKR